MAGLRETLEREVKLSPGKRFEMPELGGEALISRVFVSTYHDTPELRLARSGLTLRHRVENGRGVWQLKLPSGDSRPSSEDGSHLPRSGPVPTPTFQLNPASVLPYIARPPSRHVVGMIAVSTKLRSTP